MSIKRTAWILATVLVFVSANRVMADWPWGYASNYLPVPIPGRVLPISPCIRQFIMLTRSLTPTEAALMPAPPDAAPAPQIIVNPFVISAGPGGMATVCACKLHRR